MPATTPESGLYADATVYDVLHAPGTARELDALERVAAGHGRSPPRGPTWLEPACGTGRLVRLAASRGTRSVGFDTEPGMIGYAEGRIGSAGLGGLARVAEGDMRSFIDDGVCVPGSIDFMFNTINTFRHLMTDADALRHIAQSARALGPGGVYAVGLSTCAYGCEQPTEDVWTAARGRLGVTQVVQYIPPTGKTGGSRVERVLSHLTIQRPGGTEHRDSTYALRTYSIEQWLDLVGRSELGLIAVTDGDGNPSEPAMSGYRMYVLGT